MQNCAGPTPMQRPLGPPTLHDGWDRDPSPRGRTACPRTSPSRWSRRGCSRAQPTQRPHRHPHWHPPENSRHLNHNHTTQSPRPAPYSSWTPHRPPQRWLPAPRGFHRRPKRLPWASSDVRPPTRGCPPTPCPHRSPIRGAGCAYAETTGGFQVHGGPSTERSYPSCLQTTDAS